MGAFFAENRKQRPVSGRSYRRFVQASVANFSRAISTARRRSSSGKAGREFAGSSQCKFSRSQTSWRKRFANRRGSICRPVNSSSPGNSGAKFDVANRTLPCCKMAPAMPALRRCRRSFAVDRRATDRPVHAVGSKETEDLPDCLPPNLVQTRHRKAHCDERVDQRGMNRVVQTTSGGRQTVGGRNRQAVGQFGVVENRPAAARTANHRATEACRMAATFVGPLEVSQRQRRRRPSIAAQRSDAVGVGRFQQGLIDGHVPSAIARLIEKPPARDMTAKCSRHTARAVRRLVKRGQTRTYALRHSESACYINAHSCRHLISSR